MGGESDVAGGLVAALSPAHAAVLHTIAANSGQMPEGDRWHDEVWGSQSRRACVKCDG